MQPRHQFRACSVVAAALIASAPLAALAATPAAGTWTLTGAMHQARDFQTTTLLPNGLVLVAGGVDRSGHILASAELYHPHTGSWATTGSMHYARMQFTATLLRDGRVLVVGGMGGNGASAELFNPQTGTWTLTGFMHKPRVFHTATLLPDGTVLVAGGASGCYENGTCSAITGAAEIYDPHSGKWTLTGSMYHARARQTATLLPDGQVLAAGGAAGGANEAGANILAGAELYHPRTGTWTVTGAMHTAVSGQAATLLSNGMVLVDGGFNNGWLTGAELYHPRTGVWTVTGALHEPRGYQTGQTATLLRDGRVLVAGGCGVAACTSVLTGAEIYNPRTGTWSVTGSLYQARAFQPATLLLSGQVLIAGGSFTPGPPGALASAEVYQP